MCGLIGIVDADQASADAVEGLYAQQHRGREAAGVASANGRSIHLQGNLGEVEDVFPEGRDVPKELPGRLAIGHNRYSTSTKADAYQPIRGQYGEEEFCLAHNGNLTNKAELAALLGRDNPGECVDSELVVRLIERMRTRSFERDLPRVLRRLKGAYSFLILFPDRLYAVRDPQGCRPLVVGESKRLLAFASETCAFDTLNVDTVGEVDAGTFVRIASNRARTTFSFAPARLKRCAFEPIYFSHHTGDAYGIPLVAFRLNSGEALERECPAPADIVLGMPDSANVIAMGYGKSGRSGVCIPAVARHHNAGGRTFILPTQDKRVVAVRRKFQHARSTIKGKRVVLVDDSIVRGTTMKLEVMRVRDAGATEVHVRSAFPPDRHPCLYGIDTADDRELIAGNMSIEETRKFIGADSLEYLSEETYLRILGGSPNSWCMACVTGEYWHDTV